VRLLRQISVLVDISINIAIYVAWFWSYIIDLSR